MFSVASCLQTCLSSYLNFNLCIKLFKLSFQGQLWPKSILLVLQCNISILQWRNEKGLIFHLKTFENNLKAAFCNFYDIHFFLLRIILFVYLYFCKILLVEMAAKMSGSSHFYLERIQSKSFLLTFDSLTSYYKKLVVCLSDS